MTLRIPNEGEGRMLGTALSKYAQEVLVLKLFTNNVTPGESDTSASYTDLSGSGYADINLTGSNWTITEGAPCLAEYPKQTWTFTAATVPVYGYRIEGATSGKVWAAERFSDGPYQATQSGDKIEVIPKITGQDTLD